jgi:glycosyltransferase involved in cell wall biosynthesis
MKILIVTTSYPSVRAPHNGVLIREHCLELRRRGEDVVVLVPRVFEEDPPEADDEGIEVHRFGFWSGQRLLTEYETIPAARMSTYLFGGIAAAARLIRSERPDVVHGHWAIPTGLIAVVASGLTGRRPVIVTAHRKDIEVAQSGSRVAGALARFTLRRADRVVAVSSALRAKLVDEMGSDPALVSIVPMGVDTTAFAPSDMTAARSGLQIAPDARLVLFVGGLIPVKGVADLIEAMPSIEPDDPATLLVLAGHGPLEAELRTRAADLGWSERVRFLGAVAHDDLPRWMNAADVLVLPSYSEGLPVCLMEAAATGLPMVATDVGGSAEVLALDPRNVLVSPGDVEGLAAAITTVLAAPRSERTSMLGSAPLFTLDGCIDRMEQLYEEVVDARSSRAESR